MSTAGDAQSSNRRLGSWKEIATFFESDESTVRRWEKERGLPIHRVPGPAGTKVFAYTEELTRWLERPKAQSVSLSTATSPGGLRDAWITRLKGQTTAFIAVGCLIALSVVASVLLFPLLTTRSPPVSDSVQG